MGMTEWKAYVTSTVTFVPRSLSGVAGGVPQVGVIVRVLASSIPMTPIA